MVKLQLELGGKDPVYVCEDADVKTAAESLADGAMYNAGQSCCSVERIYVHETIPRCLRRRVRRDGEGLQESAIRWTSPPTSARSRARSLAVLERQVDDAVAKGATLLTRGGSASRARATGSKRHVLTDVNHAMELMREESFGPVIGIQRVGNDAEAVALMNDTEYGLTAGVYTPDEARARHPRARQVGLGVLELLRPREPAAAVVGRRNIRVWCHARPLASRRLRGPKAWHLEEPGMNCPTAVVRAFSSSR